MSTDLLTKSMTENYKKTFNGVAEILLRGVWYFFVDGNFNEFVGNLPEKYRTKLTTRDKRTGGQHGGGRCLRASTGAQAAF